MNAHLEGHGPVDTVVCDIDGVVVLGSQSVPQAGETLERLRDAGLSLVFATNNAARTPAMVRERLVDLTGFDPGLGNVVNSATAAARYIAGGVERVFVVGTDALRETLRAEGVGVVESWRDADAVVAGLDPRVTYESLAHASLAVQNGARFYATNTDASYPRHDGLYPGAGAIVAAIQTTTGVEPIVCGKPHAPMREMLSTVGGDHPIMVGDRPETDIALGQAEGWPTVLVLSGVVGDASAVPKEFAPDIVLDSIAGLPSALGLDR